MEQQTIDLQLEIKRYLEHIEILEIKKKAYQNLMQKVSDKKSLRYAILREKSFLCNAEIESKTRSAMVLGEHFKRNQK